jgi:hypothetical protein
VTTATTTTRFNLRTAFFASLVVLVLVSIPVLVQIGQVANYLDADQDSNMRMQQVRDLLAGQGWYDLTLYRYGIDGGTVMHWSRLADMGPAALIWLFSHFMSPQQSETAMTIVYPTLLVVPLFIALAWTTFRNVTAATTLQVSGALAFIVFQLFAFWMAFRPGMIDHHNLQIIGTIIFIGAACGQRDTRSGVIGGAGLIFGLVVGPDGLPAIAIAIAMLGILWLINPKAEAPFLAGLGGGTFVFTLLSTLVFIPRPLSTTWCDSWTLPMSSIFAGLGVFLLIAAYIGTRIANKILLGAVAMAIGCAILGSLLVVFPSCRNPLPLGDPLIQRYWMSLVFENEPIWGVLTNAPIAFAQFISPIIALISFWVGYKKKWFDLTSSLPLIGPIFAAFVFACFYLRGLPMALALSAPILAAALICALKSAPSSKDRIKAWLSLSPVLSFAMVAILALFLGPKPSAAVAAKKLAAKKLPKDIYYCISDAQLAQIKRLPVGKIVSSFSQTEYFIRHTKLQAAFAGYHRAYKTNLEIISWLTARPDSAKAAFIQHNIRYLTYCKDIGGFDLMAIDHPDSLLGVLYQDKPPAWLTPVVPLSRGGMIYEIKPQ